MALEATQSDSKQSALCGQAEEISNILSRTGSLPVPLHLTIEELLENAWEMAYRPPANGQGALVVDLAAYRTRRGAADAAMIR